MKAIGIILAAAALLSGSAAGGAAAIGDRVTLGGKLAVAFYDPHPESGMEGGETYSLTTDEGKYELVLGDEIIEAAGGLRNLTARPLAVTGRSLVADGRRVLVEGVRATGEPLEPPDRGTTGPQPYVWLLFRFADIPDTQHTVEYVEGLAEGPWPSVDHYWNEVSYGNMNCQGSDVFGWFVMPHDRDFYVWDLDNDGEGDTILGDSIRIHALAVADFDVDFTQYAGINICFNAWLDCCSWGMRDQLTLDGETRYWGLTYLAIWGWENQSVAAHEMGHALAWLPHSRTPYEDELWGSKWDLMSWKGGMENVVHPDYGIVGQHPIAFQKYDADLGWIHPAHQYYLPTTPAMATIRLHDLAEIPPAGRYLVAGVYQYEDPPKYYTVETRRFTGYDACVPAEAAVIHEVQPGRREPAWMIDYDGDGDPYDGGSYFVAGEALSDPGDGIVITVNGEDGNSSVVTLTNMGRSTVFVNGSFGGYESGSATNPWNTMIEGHSGTFDGGTISVAPGSYPEGLIVARPLTIQRWGSTGTVVIGE
ncbi:MAG: hypothetical protein ABIK65_02745 [Candidatus Eisenbacteria bacterium]